MNKYQKLLYALPTTALLLTASCTDLDTMPEGGMLTAGQKSQVQSVDPGKLEADIVALSSLLTKYGAISDWAGRTNHFDFGFASTCLMLDMSGMDMRSEDTGYNWYNENLLFKDRDATGRVTYFMWNQFYTHIKSCNDILKLATKDKAEGAMKRYRGQALANRAWDYLNLIQIYQFTYKGHEEAPGVPLVTEDMDAEQVRNNPRATVKAVYERIMTDLNEAIELLGTDRTDKSQININVAYGLRARANLLMNNWAEAVADAEKALEGYSPYTREAVSKPSFNNANDNPSWIWASLVTEENEIVKSGILNFPSMMCSLGGNGYAPGYAARYINNKLFAQIPETDVRKGWWAQGDPIMKDGKLLGYDFTQKTKSIDWEWKIEEEGKTYNIADWLGWKEPGLNIKFGPYKNIYNNPTNACDFPLMRAEEMILIKAEALAHQSKGGEAATALKVLMAERDPSWHETTVTVDDVWFQRRIELWGEGFSFFDLMRLKKGLDRRDAGWPTSAAFNLPAESQIFLWLIPEDEIEQNKALTKENNNPLAPVPTA
ncbi:MAG: RagB/SusD family nutrient uptake outer membrane protein [Bacteroides sp.]|nr:RagB/SusD family nutrient uptake outer membrane protein [Bacteroides sp.]